MPPKLYRVGEIDAFRASDLNDALCPSMIRGLRLIWRPRNKHLDPIVVGVSAFSPIILRLLRGIRDSGKSLHIFQAELDGYKQTEWRAMGHSKWVSVEVRREQGLRMASRRQIE